jgi:hypothetical protein
MPDRLYRSKDSGYFAQTNGAFRLLTSALKEPLPEEVVVTSAVAASFTVTVTVTVAPAKGAPVATRPSSVVGACGVLPRA